MSEGVVLLSYFFTVENEIFRDFEVINEEKSFIKKKQVTWMLLIVFYQNGDFVTQVSIKKNFVNGLDQYFLPIL